MTDFSVTNVGNITGTTGSDRLAYTHTLGGGVWLTNLAGSMATGYSGTFDGLGSNNSYFTGIEHFTFTDLGGGADIINTGGGDDVLNGGAGDDVLNSGAGIDNIDGGTGNDMWGADKSFASIAISINLNAASSTYLGTGTVTNIEGLNLKTGSGADVITGSNSVGMYDTIDTGAGDDLINMWFGGTDNISGGGGTDRLTVIYDVTTNNVVLNNLAVDTAGGYTGTFDGMGANDIRFSGIEHFTFTDLSGGNDTINTGDGDDVLNGGDGDDILNSGKGIDNIDGGAGNDMWGADKSFATTAITIDLNATSSTYLGTGTVTNIEGMNLKTGSGADVITGSNSVGMYDTIDTGAGDDLINMWFGGTDNISGGGGTDRLTVIYDVTTNNVVLNNLAVDTEGGYTGTFDGMDNNDIYFTGIEHFTFTDLSGGSDIINTGDGDDVLDGGAGNDVLNSGQGIDVIDGGLGNDMWGADKSFTTTAITIDLNATSSTYLGTGSVTNIEGLNLKTGSGADVITGSNSVGMYDTIDTGAGDDLINMWFGGNDNISGGGGSDRLTVIYDIATNNVALTNLAADAAGGYTGTFDGMNSNDINFSGIEHFTFTDMTGGNDTINTGDGDDVLNGGDGNDILNSGQGIDVIDGGVGNDMWGADKSFTGTAITIDLNAASSTYLGTGAVSNIEGLNLKTGSGADIITGSNSVAMNDVIDTGTGDDLINMWFGGVDTIAGGGGDDRLMVIYGVATSNNVWLTNLAADAAGGYTGTFDGMGSNDIYFTGIENFTFIDQSNGNDIITTGDGQDILSGGDGNDTLNGGNGVDALYGGNGNDVLNGGSTDASEVDAMYGGVGNDTYYVNSTSAAIDIVYEEGSFPGGASDVDTIISQGEFFWDYYSVGEVLTIEATVAAGAALISGRGDSTLNGNDSANFLLSYGGTNEINPGKGVDVIGLSLYGLAESLDGVNTVKLNPGDGNNYIYDFESGSDIIDVSTYVRFADGAQMLANVADTAWGSFVWMGETNGANEYIGIVGLSSADLDAADFVV